LFVDAWLHQVKVIGLSIKTLNPYSKAIIAGQKWAKWRDNEQNPFSFNGSLLSVTNIS
jgi:hypothetical protein